ncbi:MAG: PDZ domain-containing protein [Sandaracinus sp.]
MRVRSLVALLTFSASTLGLWACGAAAPPPERPRAERRVDPTPPVVTTPGTIQRAALDEVLSRGPGAFLSKVAVEPNLVEGRFTGFRVTELRDTALFESVDLQPGDTIVSVNGQPIERPEQAFEVWSGMRVASELTVDVLRDGQPRQLRYPIVD